MSVAEQALGLHAQRPDDLLVIVGPTASGKTALAVELCERLGGEVISADSVQVYREFDVGSGKPSDEERARAPHHLVDVADPLDPFDAALWASRADAALADIRARGRVPVVCGGTFLWVKALLYGLASIPGASDEVRARLCDVAVKEGRAALHARLAEVDPASAARLHPNDLVRVTRALEVWETTGKPLSAWHAEHGFARTREPACLIAIASEPDALTRRIESRARAWLASGWIEEVGDLLARGHGSARAMGSVGYAEVRSMLAGELPREDLESAIVRSTRLFARRQRTWLNHAEVAWVRDGSP